MAYVKDLGNMQKDPQGARTTHRSIHSATADRQTSALDVRPSPREAVKHFKGQCLILTPPPVFLVWKWNAYLGGTSFAVRGGSYEYFWRRLKYINRIFNNHCGYGHRGLALTLVTHYRAQLRPNVPQGLEDLPGSSLLLLPPDRHLQAPSDNQAQAPSLCH